ncbi:predicted protein [Naegleria gruberi]|uniref:Serine/threonine-protein kinase PLK n=1 Tax=Naegleria gruberi TaxID=5762 RepID=D2V521_NAEGR|nr:uncharacterized protein NAEGRDRAFT_63986 [Naegleria gruberi]EFC48028.1 predicted protein [Naegleria gruberi]|eukprot:XP_002680772.1 predicted protein [Naegleria gruberi strain NEG-M]
MINRNRNLGLGVGPTTSKPTTSTAALTKRSNIPVSSSASFPLSSRKNPIIQEVADKGGVKTVLTTYKQGEMLGEGGFAKCYEVTDCSSGASLAAKVIPKTSLVKEKTKEKLMTEIKIHKKMNHKYVVGFERFFEDSQNAYIMLEMCHCKSLMELMEKKRRLAESEAQYIFYQVLSAVRYMHSCRVIHRDLKLGNIFLDKYMRVKIGDFGLATEVNGQERKTTLCGTPNYIAPEILENRGHSYEVDMWSCGVILYTLLIGTPPFETSDVKSTYRKIQENRYSFPPDIKISEPAKKLIKRLLSSDPKSRPNVEQSINDEFFKTMKSTGCPSSLMKYAQSYCGQDVKKNLEVLQREREEALKRKQQDAEEGSTRSSEERAPLKSIDPNILSARGKENGVLDKLFKKVLPKKRESDENSRPCSSRSTQPPLSAKSKSPVPTSTRGSPSNSASPKLKPTRLSSRSPVPRTKVVHSIDYPDYGLAYRLSNGSTGAFFNDWSKMVLSADKKRVDYYEFQKDQVQPFDKQSTFSLVQHPEELKKKITLIKFFKGVLDQEIKKTGKPELLEISGEDSNVYVKKYHSTKQATAYRLSNMVIQVRFQDSAEVLLANSSHVAIFTNTKGEKEYIHEDSTAPEAQRYISLAKDYIKELKTDSR